MNAPKDTPGGEDQELRVAEYVLGVLDAEARAAVAREIASDAEAAAAAARWERHLLPLAELVPETSPSSHLWSRIVSATQASTSMQPVRGRWSSSLWLWRSIGIGASALAAVLLVLVLLRPTRLLVRPVYLAATIQQTNGAAGWTATLDAQRAQLIVVPAMPVAVPQTRAAELWLIPAGAKPVALGLIATGEPVTLRLDASSLAQLRPSAMLAVSIEPPGGSPTGQPTGPVIGTGAIREVPAPHSPT